MTRRQVVRAEVFFAELGGDGEPRQARPGPDVAADTDPVRPEARVVDDYQVGYELSGFAIEV